MHNQDTSLRNWQICINKLRDHYIILRQGYVSFIRDGIFIEIFYDKSNDHNKFENNNYYSYFGIFVHKSYP